MHEEPEKMLNQNHNFFIIISNNSKRETEERIEIESILSIKNFCFYYIVVEGDINTLETISRAFDSNIQIIIVPVSW